MNPWLVIVLLAAVVLCMTFAQLRTGQAASGPATTAPIGPIPPLTAEEKSVILDKGTEPPYTGKYTNTTAQGVYVCRQCGSPLYLSESKFPSSCGWPSFDDEIPGAVKRQADADGHRMEILCAHCNAHLGHVFTGEGLTPRDTRHCVNSVSMVFMPSGQWPLERAVFAGGCFWGVEHAFRGVPGVIAVRSGYTGGQTARPTYKQVCTGRTGHAESVEILFDPAKVSYETLARQFFNLHDPTQKNYQGPDAGTQYRSAVFYTTPQQKETTEKLITLLRQRGYNVVTEVTAAETFWPAEEYHQDYLNKHPQRPCHVPVDRFGDTAQPAEAATQRAK